MPHTPSRLLDLFDPRHSLATGIGWLVLSLSLGFAALAGFWAGDITRAALLQKHNERAINAAEQWSRGLDAAFAQRRQPLRAAAAMVPAALREDDSARLDAVFADLHNAYPELSWIGLARTDGRLVASTLHEASHADVSGQAWFRNGLKGSWLALDQPLPQRAGQPAGVRGLMLAVPVLDAHGHAIGVAGARLDWQWVLGAAQGLQARIPYLADANADALLLDAQGRVLIGPKALLGQAVRAQEPSEDPDPLVTASTTPGGSLQALGWNAAVMSPWADATRKADDARRHMVWIAIGLGAATAVVGVALARRLTRRLIALTDAVRAAESHTNRPIDAPQGTDEVSQLGRAFNELLASLHTERNALTAMTAELELRVQARTREVERLADEARYAAVMRERLRIARDLHDTLAHSMMAMLAEVRILKKLHVHDPAALADELDRAEQTARNGIGEARAAIEQMRFSSVRDLGLGGALKAAIAHFIARTGIEVAFTAASRAADFADSRAEAMFRITEEALRNVERHAAASTVRVVLEDVDDGEVRLAISDDGIGFDTSVRRPGHYGLVGLREQAQLIGAVLSIESELGAGTRLSMRLPTR